jgi:hypothetical protein
MLNSLYNPHQLTVWHMYVVSADPPGVDMYVELKKTKAGLTAWRCKRGSSKNEAANLVIERSLHTTAKMTQLTATGQLHNEPRGEGCACCVYGWLG